ncbi:MAG: hypothetical protein RJA55_578 [Acidobacteriota bacterium]|jgi:hypothetical protein
MRLSDSSVITEKQLRKADAEYINSTRVLTYSVPYTTL